MVSVWKPSAERRVRLYQNTQNDGPSTKNRIRRTKNCDAPRTRLITNAHRRRHTFAHIEYLRLPLLLRKFQSHTHVRLWPNASHIDRARQMPQHNCTTPRGSFSGEFSARAHTHTRAQIRAGKHTQRCLPVLLRTLRGTGAAYRSRACYHAALQPEGRCWGDVGAGGLRWVEGYGAIFGANDRGSMLRRCSRRRRERVRAAQSRAPVWHASPSCEKEVSRSPTVAGRAGLYSMVVEILYVYAGKLSVQKDQERCE